MNNDAAEATVRWGYQSIHWRRPIGAVLLWPQTAAISTLPFTNMQRQ